MLDFYCACYSLLFFKLQCCCLLTRSKKAKRLCQEQEVRWFPYNKLSQICSWIFRICSGPSCVLWLDTFTCVIITFSFNIRMGFNPTPSKYSAAPGLKICLAVLGLRCALYDKLKADTNQFSLPKIWTLDSFFVLQGNKFSFIPPHSISFFNWCTYTTRTFFGASFPV